jgi:ATP/maltotriose-dependent transcriptional regulator MalT
MPWKYSLTSAARKQRAAQTAKRGRQLERERLEAEWDEQDAEVYRGSAITTRTETLAAQMANGTAKLSDVQEVLAEDFSAEPYADLRVLTSQCMLMGLDPGTGALSQGASQFLTYVRNGQSVAQAQASAMVIPTSLDLWLQDEDFRTEFGGLTC